MPIPRRRSLPGTLLGFGVIEIRISRLTPAELISAFAIEVRTQAISREDAGLLLRQFHDDLATGKLAVYSIAESEFAVAEKLVEKYAFDRRLRALDTLQLAVALELRSQVYSITSSRQMRLSVRSPN